MVEGAPILLHKMVTVEEKKLIDTEEMVKPDLVRENIEQDSNGERIIRSNTSYGRIH